MPSAREGCAVAIGVQGFGYIYAVCGLVGTDETAARDGDYFLAELPDNAAGQLALVRKVDSAIETLKKSALTTFGKSVINNAPDAFIDKIDGVLAHYEFNTGGTTRKWTRTDLEKMMAYRVDNPKLTPSEKVNLATLTQIRQKLASIDENTILQKVLSPTVAEDYFNNKYSTVINSIARAQDTKHLKNVEDLYHGLALGFDGSPFKPSDDFFYVLRFKTSEPAKAYISNTEQLLAKLKRPFTGNGFTSGGFSRMGVPELWANNMAMTEAAIFKVYKDGSEEVISVFVKDIDNVKRFKSK